MYPSKLITLYYSRWCASIGEESVIVKYVIETHQCVSMSTGTRVVEFAPPPIYILCKRDILNQWCKICNAIVMCERNTNKRIVVYALQGYYVIIISRGQIVKNAMVVQYESLKSLNHIVQIVMVHEYVNLGKNHIRPDVGREAIENLAVFAHIALLIFVQMILKEKA